MLIYIKPLSTFPKLHSDTLFGAITYAISELYPDILDQMLVDFEEGNPPFILSSAFPVIFNDEYKIKFFPKIIMDNDLSELDSKVLKNYKKISYIEEEIFFDLINGSLDELDLLRNYDNYYKFSNLLMKKDFNVDIGFGENILPNNLVNRLNNETKIFYSNGDSYKNLGLFFLIDFHDDDFRNIIESALKFLKDRGFGKDVSTGKGHFDYEVEKNVSLKFEGNTFISLSRYIPTSSDLKKINDYSYYEIGSKRGRDKSGEIRKQVHFFKEGSTFPNYQLNYGKIITSGDVNPGVEYGYAFPVRYNSRRYLNES